MSGVDGVFGDRLVEEAVHKPMVSWLAKSEKDLKTYFLEALEEAKAASTSLAWRAGGGDSLGLRLKKAPAALPVSTWRVKGVPASWTESDLLKVLSDAGWSNGQVIVFPTKKIRPWLIRVQPYNQVTGLLAGIQVGDQFLTLEKASGHVPVDRSSVKFANKPAHGKPSVAFPVSKCLALRKVSLRTWNLMFQLLFLRLMRPWKIKSCKLLKRRMLVGLNVGAVPKVVLLKSTTQVPHLKRQVRSLAPALFRFMKSIRVLVVVADIVVLLLGLLL